MLTTEGLKVTLMYLNMELNRFSLEVPTPEERPMLHRLNEAARKGPTIRARIPTMRSSKEWKVELVVAYAPLRLDARMHMPGEIEQAFLFSTPIPVTDELFAGDELKRALWLDLLQSTMDFVTHCGGGSVETRESFN